MNEKPLATPAAAAEYYYYYVLAFPLCVFFRGPLDMNDSLILFLKTELNSTGESELIWRRVKQQQQQQQQQGKPAATPSWAAINYELKNRQQKIAKVRPTPHHRTMTVGGPMIDVSSSRRSSDYAQLCEFASGSTDSPRGLHLDVHSKNDDDAVSVAGTVFNEPWDSNVWENLLDLAHHGDENPHGLNRTAGGGSTSQMDSDEDDDDEEEEELRWPTEQKLRRTLPSDRVLIKGWEQDDASSAKYSTLDSRGNIGGTHKRNPEGSFSMRSLPRAVSRFSQAMGLTAIGSFGSIDDLPTTLPSMSPLLGGRTSRGTNPSTDSNEKIGRAVQNYVEQLAQVREGANSCFGLTLRQFVACTKETKETDPSVVVRNVRQFINGMKNYLVKHGEGDLHRIIDEESARLNSNQILNIDAVLEAVLHKLLLREVKPLLYHVMVREHSKSGTLQLISSNIGIVRKMSLQQLGFNNADKLVIPNQQTMENVKLMMRKMQSHYSPLKKLENLMKSVSMVVGCQDKSAALVNEENADPAMQKGIPAADDLVRWLVYILARTSTVGCEVEAWYMWELLPQPILMQSDASYYLTALFSAVHVLKSAEAIRRLGEHDDKVISHIDLSRQCCSSPMLSTATLTRGHSPKISTMTTATCDAFVRIAVPDETVGCVRYATFPGVPVLTTSKLSRLVAHQQGITNPEEHGLYLISDGFESCLQPADCPVMIHEQLKKENKPHIFAYKRHEAKIVWPRAVISSC
ncbi:unnamed protein product [Caenorhabditis bovis]|uniref:VPS9 domain-containing protein n=1 Tax=Caenorhabditis bovis TaxID=2654633 RepID=A0A8S1EFH2_9PELO|nr:unnamed protein product [Caenorhabditis bovis]